MLIACILAFEPLRKIFLWRRLNKYWVNFFEIINCSNLDAGVISFAIAAQETHQLGPYTVSFNMNTNPNYKIQTPQSTASASGKIFPLMMITDNNTGGSMSIIQYNNLTTSTLAINEEILALRMALSGFNATSVQQLPIDGQRGFLISAVPLARIRNIAPNFVLWGRILAWQQWLPMWSGFHRNNNGGGNIHLSAGCDERNSG